MDQGQNGQLLKVRWLCWLGSLGPLGNRCLFHRENTGQLLEVELDRAGVSVVSEVSLWVLLGLLCFLGISLLSWDLRGL